jgi:hypothetical protein
MLRTEVKFCAFAGTKTQGTQALGLAVGRRREGPTMADNWYWYHFIATTYGAWLYGDSRGFRTRHHREHIEGDYKNPPPPGMYADKEQCSRESMSEPPVILPVELRPVVGMAILKRLRDLGAEVLVLSVSGQHIHGQARMPYGQPKRWVGMAKRHVWFELRDLGWQGKLWGKGSKAIPIENRGHQVNTFFYILRHAQQGAWVWDFRQEKELPPPPKTPSPGVAPPGESSS